MSNMPNILVVEYRWRYLVRCNFGAIGIYKWMVDSQSVIASCTQLKFALAYKIWIGPMMNITKVLDVHKAASLNAILGLPTPLGITFLNFSIIVLDLYRNN